MYWGIDVLATGIKPLEKVMWTLHRHKKGILNYFKHNITNALAEGINNKIKTMKRQAYGFRDIEYFKLRLYHLHPKFPKIIHRLVTQSQMQQKFLFVF